MCCLLRLIFLKIDPILYLYNADDIDVLLWLKVFLSRACEELLSRSVLLLVCVVFFAVTCKKCADGFNCCYFYFALWWAAFKLFLFKFVLVWNMYFHMYVWIWLIFWLNIRRYMYTVFGEIGMSYIVIEGFW